MKTKWIRIENESNLPKERGDIWVVCKGRVNIYNDFDPKDEKCANYCINNFTHWQKLEKPEFNQYYLSDVEHKKLMKGLYPS